MNPNTSPLCNQLWINRICEMCVSRQRPDSHKHVQSVKFSQLAVQPEGKETRRRRRSRRSRLPQHRVGSQGKKETVETQFFLSLSLFSVCSVSVGVSIKHTHTRTHMFRSTGFQRHECVEDKSKVRTCRRSNSEQIHAC